MVSITPGDGQDSVSMRVGETLTVSLPENATTGYRWALDHYDPDLLELGPEAPAYGSASVGTGGSVLFSLIGRKRGEADVAFKYWRHWEGDTSIRSRFRFRAAVTD